MSSNSFQSLSIARQLYFRPLLFGVALSKEQLSDPEVKKYARYIFDSITCFDDLKPDSIRTIRTITDYSLDSSYNFSNLNDIMNYAKNSLMKVSGASLWDDPEHNPSPLNVLKTSASDKITMSNILSNHVTQTITHFKNNYANLVYNWQVLDEADSTSQANRVVGPVYFSNLYNYAENALENALSNTKVKLFYNDDYNKIDNHQTVLLSLKRDEKIDGIGVKCHVSSTDITATRSLAKILLDIENITKKYRSNGFEVHFTEIDFNTATLNNLEITNYYVGLLDIALKYGVTNYTVWGLKDDLSPLHTAARAKYPLLLNGSFQPKFSYNELLRKLKDFKRDQDYDIFIILGQSNSIGWGRTIDPNIERIGSIMDEDYDNTENPLIEQWTNYKDSPQNEIIVAKERLYHLLPGFSPGTDNDYGLAISFARQYIREGKLSANRKILLIGSGWNGTGFLNQTAQHWRVKTGSLSDGEIRLYDMSLDRIRSAISPGIVGTNSVVKGIFWVQGERDAVDATKSSTKVPAPPLPPCPPSLPARGTSIAVNRDDDDRNELLSEYEKLLTKMLNELRINVTKYINNVRTFNLPKQLPETVPILIGSIPNLNTPCNYRDDYLYMIELLKNIPSKKNLITNSKFVPSDIISETVFNHFLTTGGPELNYHYNKSSQIEFGKRFFYYYNNLSIDVTTDYDIFIIMGQSNSVGRGILEDSNIPRIGTIMEDDYANIENPDIKMYDGKQFIPAKERLFHFSSQSSSTSPCYGFGVSFARQYVRERKLLARRKVLLIGCGFDGAGVLRTHTRHWNSKIRDSLYDQTVRRVRDVVNNVGVGRASEIKGILWHQGETDAKYIKLREFDDVSGAPVVNYNDYKEELKLTLDGLRTEFTTIINNKRRGVQAPARTPAPTPARAPAPTPARVPAPALPPAQVATNIPILLGSILNITNFGSGREDYGYTDMIPIIKEVADARDNINYSFVPVTPITGTVFRQTLTGNGASSNDPVHFNKSSQIELGKRYYYVYNNNRITITYAPAPRR